MTFDEITTKLRESQLEYTLPALLLAVREEARLIQDTEVQQNKRKLTQKFLTDCEQKAQALYAVDITAFYDTNGALEPDHVLQNRRTAMAWTVAQKLLQMRGRGCPLCGTALKFMGQQPIYDPTQNQYYTANVYQCGQNHDLFLRGEPIHGQT